MKPILFNTEMVRAILDGRKTVTRRKIDIDIINHCDIDTDGTLLDYQNSYGDFINPVDLCRYKAGDILYARETWQDGSFLEDGKGNTVKYIYKADDTKDENSYSAWGIKWKPSIHMPKDAARIFLRAKEVRVERLQDMVDFRAEGIKTSETCDICHAVNGKCYPEHASCDNEVETFGNLWDSAIKKPELERYGWNANPWVWVIEFERISKEEDDENNSN